MNKIEANITALKSISEHINKCLDDLYASSPTEDNALLIETYTAYSRTLEDKIVTQQKRLENLDKPRKAEYICVTGKVEKVNSVNERLPFSMWTWVVSIPEIDQNKPGTFKLLPGRFTKDAAPKVGDTVKIRSRKTKYRTKFYAYDAKIFEIVNDK